MSASSILRQYLDNAGIEYGKPDDYTTYVLHDGMSFMFDDCRNGALLARMLMLTPEDAANIVTNYRRHTSKKYINHGDGVGHSECTACGTVVGSGHRYCPWCGAKFDGIDRVMI